MASEEIFWAAYPSQIGDLIVISGHEGIRELRIKGSKAAVLREYAKTSVTLIERPAFFKTLFREFDLYFKGKRVEFSCRLDPVGSAFDKKVWKILRSVQWGRTISYGGLATRAGFKAAARAIGGACGRNPVPIIIPCHRVLRADGSIGGYSGGLGVKEKLLALEGVDIG